MYKLYSWLRILVVLALLETVVYCFGTERHQTGRQNELSDTIPLMGVSAANAGTYITKRSSAFGPGLLNRITDIMSSGRPRSRGGLFNWRTVADPQTELPEPIAEEKEDDPVVSEPDQPIVLSNRMARICYMNPVSCFGRRMNWDKRQTRF